MEPTRTPDAIAAALQAAFATKDLDRLADVLADDARWGDDANPNRCRSRADVVSTFRRLLGEGVTGEVTECHVGEGGVAVHLHVEWPEPATGRAADLWQSYLVREGEVVEIEPHDGRRSALRAISS